MADSIQKEQIRNALTHVLHPVEGADLISLEMVQDLIVQEKYVSFTLELPAKNDELSRELIRLSTQAIHRFVDAQAVVDITVGINISAGKRQQASAGAAGAHNGATGTASPSAAPVAHTVDDHDHLEAADAAASRPAAGPSGSPQSAAPTPQPLLANARHVIAVASGKGGVGKSTVASNLAVALAASGARVGLIDTDIYGPSVPTMFDVHERPSITTQRKLVPIQKYGVHLISMGFLIDPDQAMIWRGPMVTSAVKQFMQEVDWPELDYMVLDLPPGTGDIQLTLVQQVPLTGAVIVSTPQTVALDDARKGVAMFDKVQVPILGIVENMAWFSPPELPDNKYYIFGKHGARKLAARLEVPFLGEVPLIEAIREGGDKGMPVVLSDPESQQGEAFRLIAQRVIEGVEALETVGGTDTDVTIRIHE